VLRSDNGGEYTSKDFNDFCIEVGIKREYTIFYNPQQNGVAERKNRSIIEETKVMIHDQSLPMMMWEKESMKTMFVQNKSPHKIMKNTTLEESFLRVKHVVGHFRIFGCPIYFHVPKEKRTKLDPSVRNNTFVGYNESSKAYWIYIPSKRQIKVNRDVTFEEEIAFRRSRESYMDIDSEKKEEIIPSPPSTVHRKTIIDQIDPVDHVAPVDVPGDIAVGQKRPSWA
jgi:transposase InsO family protein